MIVELKDLPPNATGFVQIRNGLNCFAPFQIGGIWRKNDPEAFMFEANENGTVVEELTYGDVTVDSLMGRIVLILLQDDNNSTHRIGCGTVGLSYPTILGAYPGVPAKAQGSIAVTGPREGNNSGEAAHDPTIVQLAFALTGLPPSSSGKIQVFSGGNCQNVSEIGTIMGTNWTSTYTADASGAAIGNADITHVNPNFGILEYMNHAVVVFDSNASPLACAILSCPTGSIEEGMTGGMNMQHGRCVPTSLWGSSTVIAADFYSSQTVPVQVQVSGTAFDLNYGQVRSYPACSELGKIVETSFFIRRATNVQSVLAGQFAPLPGVRNVVALGDRQPESVGRLDNNANVSFIQSVQASTHDIVHLAVGVDDVIFRVAAPGHRSEAKLHFRSHATISFPKSPNPINTTVWITNVATGAVIYQKAFPFGKGSPNFVWFLYGWDASAPDCTNKQKNCQNTPISVVTWPGLREDYGPGEIPPITQYDSGFACVPSLLVALLMPLLF
jgi:hypothetical protein